MYQVDYKTYVLVREKLNETKSIELISIIFVV